MTIQQVANELAVSTKTLRRWEEKRYFVPERQDTTNIRLYHTWVVGYWKRFLELDRALRKHLKLLGNLRKELDKFIITKPLDGVIRPPLDGRAFQKAHDAVEKWELIYKEMLKELVEYPNLMRQAKKDISEKKL